MEQPKCEYCNARGHDTPADCGVKINGTFRALCANDADKLGIAVAQF